MRLPYPGREKLLIFKTRPMCWLAIGFLVIISSFLLGRSLPETELISGTRILLEGKIVQKEYKESGYGGYWQLTLKQVKMDTEDSRKSPNKKQGMFQKNGDQESEVVSLEGRYLCQIPEGETSEFKIGQLILAEGTYEAFELPSNPGQFDTKKYYGSLGIFGQFKKCKVIKQGNSFSKLREGMWKIRSLVRESLMQQLGEENGALVSAMLLGEKSGVSKEDKNLYQRNGISHILAISGLHLSLLGMGVFKVLKILLADHKQASVIAILIMSLYCVFTGNSISTIRATIMFALSLLAGIFGRSYDSLSALGLSAILQLFWNPYVLYNSGFWLSFLAVIGVTFVAPGLQELLRVKSKLGKSLCVSLSASITTLPVLLSNYGTYPWYSVFLNLLILPVMSVLLFLTVVLVGLGFMEKAALFEILNKLVILGIQGILKYFESCCKIFQPMGAWDSYIGAPEIWQIAVYAILVVVAVSRRIKHFPLGRVMLLLSAISILTLKLSYGAEVTMLDVGQGDCVVIRNSNGNVYLSDCGSSSVNQVGKYRLLPYLKHIGYGRIQGIFLSHLDKDHMNGILELMEMAEEENIRIKYLFLSESILRGGQNTEDIRNAEKLQSTEEDREIIKELKRLAEQNKTKIVYLSQNEIIQDGKMRFYCLYPKGEAFEETLESGNNAFGEGKLTDKEALNVKVTSANKSGVNANNRNQQSLVLLMQYQDFEMIFTGDIEKQGEKEIVEYIEDLDEYLEGLNEKRRTVGTKNDSEGKKEFQKERESLIGVNLGEDEFQETNIGIDVLKVAHHGSSGSSCEEFLEMVQPKLALISCGKNNSYGHPHKETLERLEEAGSYIMSTTESGAITIKIGEKIKIYEFRK